MPDDQIIRAGAAILNDLSLFNQAAIFFEEQVDPAIRIAVGDSVKEWIRQTGWIGDANVPNSFTEMWVAPPSWVEDKDEPFARFWFQLQSWKVTNSYESADLFGLGQTNFGFRFIPEYSWFGGKAGWNTFSKSIGDQAEKLSKKNWLHEGKGVFFQPVPLKADCLVLAWENEDWSVALAPLISALDSLVTVQKLFDTLLYRAKPGR